MNRVHFESKTPEWETPQDLFNELDREFHFTLDVASTHENTKCEKHYTAEEDGLSQEWSGVVWCNPPYGKQVKKWIKKAYEEFAKHKNTIVMLLPARTDTLWFHNYILGKAEVRFIKGRLRFNNVSTDAPFPNMIVIYKEKQKEKIIEALAI